MLLLFSAVLERAVGICRVRQIPFYFVYLPQFERYTTTPHRAGAFQIRDKVIETVSQHDIPIIDFEATVTRSWSPISLYGRIDGYHFTAEGYELVADMIAKTLR